MRSLIGLIDVGKIRVVVDGYCGEPNRMVTVLGDHLGRYKVPHEPKIRIVLLLRYLFMLRSVVKPIMTPIRVRDPTHTYLVLVTISLVFEEQLLGFNENRLVNLPPIRQTTVY